MDEVSEPELTEATDESSSVGFEMLSAVHLLLSSERITDQRDLLISTCLEALSSGPISLDALLGAVNEIWPGSKISRESLELALTEAQDFGLIALQKTLTGHDWALAKDGQREIDASRQWFSDAMERLARQIEDRARNDFGELTFDVASLWAQLILKIFSMEIARSAQAYAGDVQTSAAGTLRPMILDGGRMMKELEGRSLADGTRDFLQGCLLAAVDESDPFGNELVGQVATSCVLHSIAAGRARVAAQQALGSLQGERMVLDTPVLVAYLGASISQARLKSVISQAVRLGMEVIAPEHVFDELSDVIERVTKDHLSSLVSALGTGTSPRTYAMTVNEQILELFLDGVEEDLYTNWNDFVSRVNGLKGELEALGVRVRPHNNQNQSNVNWADVELAKEIETATSGRSAKAIARDAETIELVWRARRRVSRTKNRTSLWPGGWIVSYDRHISGAYRRLNRFDTEPLVMTPAQWATLMAEASPPAEIPELVQAAASYLRQESMLRIATKYPPAIALTLAKSLSGESSSTTDLRVAQMSSLSELLEQTSSGLTVTGERLATELVSRRGERLAAAGKQQMDLVGLERARLDAQLTRSTTVVSEEHAARVLAEKRADDLEARSKLAPRQVVSAAVITGGIALTIILCIVHFWGFAIGTAGATIVFARLSRDWVREPSVKHWHLLWALIPEVIGLVDIAGWIRI